eukprot:TRINITY_DN12460_c0_g1_i1.p1 TRINITY_DN12460_c0_g1~~TRINITY_DN12460_c0_g1_i1.p1  ORF type:complete len:202 (-),score=30.15 TRINITY_DN12460_c0_g1_i1:32-637(-)
MSICEPCRNEYITGFNYKKRPTTRDIDLFDHHSSSLFQLHTSHIAVLPEQQSSVNTREFICGNHGCRLKFDNEIDYEDHYKSVHMNVCGTCRGIYPSQHILEIHMLEHHDVLFILLSEQRDMYSCFVENCTVKFRDGEARKQHLIDVHCYPDTYRFERIIAPKLSKADKKFKNRMNVEQTPQYSFPNKISFGAAPKMFPKR